MIAEVRYTGSGSILLYYLEYRPSNLDLLIDLEYGVLYKPLMYTTKAVTITR